MCEDDLLRQPQTTPLSLAAFLGSDSLLAMVTDMAKTGVLLAIAIAIAIAMGFYI